MQGQGAVTLHVGHNAMLKVTHQDNGYFVFQKYRIVGNKVLCSGNPYAVIVLWQKFYFSEAFESCG